MTEAASRVPLADRLRGWAPAPVESVRRVDPWAAGAFAALLDVASPVRAEGDPLPPLWHWFTLVDAVPQRELGADGHPRDGAFLPPLPGRRRMFAGGRLRQWAPIPVGARLTGRSALAGVTVRTGRTGELAFVTVREELFADDRHVATEEQDLVYRCEPDGAPRRRVTAPGPAEVTGTPRRALAVDPMLLFRFSALTYNAHRIHYDLPYARAVEGYPGLVVHGPLLALLALELPRLSRPDTPVRVFDYRLVRPVFAPAEIEAVARSGGADGTEVVVGARACEPSLTATMAFAGSRGGEDRP